MTYNIKVNPTANNPINDVFDWITAQGWQHIVEWRWFKPDYYNLETHYTFQFDNDKHAEWFMLRWAS